VADLRSADERRALALDERVTLAASIHQSLSDRRDHLLWLIRNAPTLDLETLASAEFFWQFAERDQDAVRVAWEAVLERVTSPAAVRNAAGSLVAMQPWVVERLYRSRQMVEPVSHEWHLGLAELYHWWIDMHGLQRAVPDGSPEHFREVAVLGRLGLCSYWASFVLMQDRPSERKNLLWPMRQCAGAAGEPGMALLLREFDGERTGFEGS
jgi:hypothetical protein